MHDLERATPHSAQGSSRCRRVEGPLAETADFGKEEPQRRAQATAATRRGALTSPGAMIRQGYGTPTLAKPSKEFVKHKRQSLSPENRQSSAFSPPSRGLGRASKVPPPKSPHGGEAAIFSRSVSRGGEIAANAAESAGCNNIPGLKGMINDIFDAADTNKDGRVHIDGEQVSRDAVLDVLKSKRASHESVLLTADRGANVQAAVEIMADARLAGFESVAIADPTYTRARTILALDAARRGDARSAENYIEQTMALPENRYNPVLLSQLALLQHLLPLVPEEAIASNRAQPPLCLRLPLLPNQREDWGGVEVFA